MILTTFYKTNCLFALLMSISLCSWGQSIPNAAKNKTTKPYKILTQGNQITLRSTQNIESVMVWTSSGHRVLETRAINKLEYQFQITVRDRFYFIMIRTSDGKNFSEKIGLRI